MSGQQPYPYLEIKNISHRYGQKIVIDDVSLSAQKGEIVALLGPSGSGKSTLLAVIAGILKPHAGQIFVNGRNLLELAPESRELGMVFQDYALWPHMTVAENIAFPLRSRRYPRPEIEARVAETLRRVGLDGFEHNRPSQLSGGQQQRVALARAVIAETKLLLLDEPLSALDPSTRNAVRSELADVLRELGLTSIIVTHDREEAFELADRVAILIEGQIQQYAKAEQVYEHPANLTVARFMGLNVLPVQMLSDGQAQLGQWHIEIPRHSGEGFSHVAVVPERTSIVKNGEGIKNVIPGELVHTQYCGGEYRLQVNIGKGDAACIVEARSKEAPQEGSLLVHLPVDAMHIIREPAWPGNSLPVGKYAASQELRIFKEEPA
jgi:ABC-type Fe3+/spermidine/putrescine transport system ATPase subunit